MIVQPIFVGFNDQGEEVARSEIIPVLIDDIAMHIQHFVNAHNRKGKAIVRVVVDLAISI